MTTHYRGTIRNGVVVFDATPPLPEGTSVRVEPVDVAAPGAGGGASPGSRDAVLAFSGGWQGPAAEIDGLLRDVNRMRDEDVEMQRRRDALNGELSP
jgi:hypothetical protein